MTPANVIVHVDDPWFRCKPACHFTPIRTSADEYGGEIWAALGAEPTMIEADVAWRTSRGLLREDNQDAVIILPSPAEDGALLGVFDGLGGPSGGAVASQTAAGSLARALARLNGPIPSGDFEPWLGRAMIDAHHEVRRRAKADETKGQTTGTLLCLTQREAILAHVGDSRCYRLRGGALQHSFQQLTTDHTMIECLARTFAEKDRMSREDALAEAYGSGWKDHLVQTIGNPDDDPDTEIFRTDLLPGDVFLLATDGLHGAVPDARIAEVLATSSSAAEAERRLVEDAYAFASSDNVTVLVARIQSIQNATGGPKKDR